jgi:hypothetical protein
MMDRPTGPKLVSAVRRFLENELIPTQTDARLRFQTLIAANVLAIAEREWQRGEELTAADCRWLGRWVGEVGPNQLRDKTEELCLRIRGGDFDGPDQFRQLAADVRQSVERKLETANPRYLNAFKGKKMEAEK